MRFTCSAIVFLAVGVPALADKPLYKFACRVMAITDGDTLTVREEDGAQHTIRLAGIDAPELGQRFGATAREALRPKVHYRMVRVDINAHEFVWYRLVGRVYVGERFINAEMVRDGFAWRDVQHDSAREFTAAEAEARKHRRGLWADKDPMPPWEWRRMMHAYADR